MRFDITAINQIHNILDTITMTTIHIYLQFLHTSTLYTHSLLIHEEDTTVVSTS